jgi:catechol 2,3-dioxygenase-like lactoylglutathione lyase family enzyme
MTSSSTVSGQIPTAVLEHVNITVTDPDRTAAMLGRLFDWHVRWRGPAKLDGLTVHVGTADQYLAIYTLDPGAPSAPDSGTIVGGLNHVGIVVADLDAAETRVVAEGLMPNNHADYEPGRRFYFDDPDGVEYEIVSY